MEQVACHAHYLRLHFANSREKICVQGIGVGGLAVHFSDELHQIRLVAVDRARYTTITPVVVTSLQVLIHQSEDLLLAESLLGQSFRVGKVGVALFDFRLEVVFGLGQFSLHLTTHGWNLLGKLKELTLATNVKILGEKIME